MRGLMKDKKLEIEWIPSSLMLDDDLMKALLTGSFKKHQEEWGLIVD